MLQYTMDINQSTTDLRLCSKLVKRLPVAAPMQHVVLVVPLQHDARVRLGRLAARHRHHRVQLVRREPARVGVRQQQRVLSQSRKKETLYFLKLIH